MPSKMACPWPLLSWISKIPWLRGSYPDWRHAKTYLIAGAMTSCINGWILQALWIMSRPKNGKPQHLRSSVGYSRVTPCLPWFSSSLIFLKEGLNQGRFTWRHDSVLKCLASIIREGIPPSSKLFVDLPGLRANDLPPATISTDISIPQQQDLV